LERNTKRLFRKEGTRRKNKEPEIKEGETQ
jgi:hypothetical protein